MIDFSNTSWIFLIDDLLAGSGSSGSELSAVDSTTILAPSLSSGRLSTCCPPLVAKLTREFLTDHQLCAVTNGSNRNNAGVDVGESKQPAMVCSLATGPRLRDLRCDVTVIRRCHHRSGLESIRQRLLLRNAAAARTSRTRNASTRCRDRGEPPYISCRHGALVAVVNGVIVFLLLGLPA